MSTITTHSACLGSYQINIPSKQTQQREGGGSSPADGLRVLRELLPEVVRDRRRLPGAAEAQERIHLGRQREAFRVDLHRRHDEASRGRRVNSTGAAATRKSNMTSTQDCVCFSGQLLSLAVEIQAFGARLTTTVHDLAFSK